MQESSSARTLRIVAYALSFAALVFIMRQGLLAALLSGLLVHSLVHQLAPRLVERRFSNRRAKLVAVTVLGMLIIGALSLAIWAGIAFFKSDAGNMESLLQRLADIIEASRGETPEWLLRYIPADAQGLRAMMTDWLREHAVDAKLAGERVGRAAAHLLVGMIVGAMVALHERMSEHAYLPLAAALVQRIEILSDAFERVVFAQVRIAAINAALTAVYLMIVLPLLGVNLPLTKTLVLVTFLAGLLPVIGNLISNTLIVIVALSASLQVAFGSLLFLVLIHKLEYFLNARIIGSHIQARTWELLVAMLVMEAAFGLYGVIAAPVLYAYLKMELMAQRMV